MDILPEIWIKAQNRGYPPEFRGYPLTPLRSRAQNPHIFMKFNNQTTVIRQQTTINLNNLQKIQN